jgi:hypothetical protein
LKAHGHRPEECERAVWRGVRLLPRFARRPSHFGDWGSDFLNYFYVVYTLNDYDKYRLRTAWLPQESAFLKKHFASPDSNLCYNPPSILPVLCMRHVPQFQEGSL